jgi:solute:Na+ symporter, SSS family
LYTIGFTTVCWVTAAFSAPGTDEKTLLAFYRKVRPFGPGWRPIQKMVKLTPEEVASVDHNNIPLALLGWFAGCTMIWSALFTVGNFLYGRMDYAAILLGAFLISGSMLIYVMNRLWAKPTQ